MKDTNRFVFSLSNKLGELDDGLIFLDGYVEHEFVRYYAGELRAEEGEEKARKVQENGKAYGEWLAVFKEGANLYCSLDFFGFYRLYYCEVKKERGEGKLIVSNCFNSLNRFVIDFEGVVPELDHEAVLPILTSSDRVFNIPYSDATFSSGIKVIRPGESLKYNICSTDLEIVSAFGNDDVDSFGELVKKGKEYLAHCFDEIGKGGFRPLLYLSGGKDSRLCLSSMLHFLSVEDFNLSTIVPSGKESPDIYKVLSDDYLISTYLSATYGVKYLENDSYDSLKLTPKSYFKYLSKYRSNNYFSQVSASGKFAFVGAGSSHQVVEVRGGAGESLRTSSDYPIIKSKSDRLGAGIVNSSASVEDDISRMFDMLSATGWDSPVYHRAKEAYIKYFMSYPGDNIEEKLFGRFFTDRNNRHFGHHREKLEQGKRTFFPLANPYWYQAANRLSFAERRDRVFFESLYECLESTVRLVPYAGDKDIHEVCGDSPLPRSFAKLKPNKSKPSRFFFGPSKENVGFFEYISCEARQMISVIFDFHSSRESFLSPSIEKYLKKKVDMEEAVSLVTFLKIKSVFDALEPSVSSYKIYE